MLECANRTTIKRIIYYLTPPPREDKQKQNLIILQSNVLIKNMRSALSSTWRFATQVITLDGIQWAIDSFTPYKSADVDGIFPIFLQEEQKNLVGTITRLFRACFCTGLHTRSLEKNHGSVYS